MKFDGLAAITYYVCGAVAGIMAMAIYCAHHP